MPHKESLELVRKQELSLLLYTLRIDTEKRQYRTSKVNTLFSVKRSFSNEKAGVKKGLPINSDEESVLVAGVGLEPTTFGL